MYKGGKFVAKVGPLRLCPIDTLTAFTERVQGLLRGHEWTVAIHFTQMEMIRLGYPAESVNRLASAWLRGDPLPAYRNYIARMEALHGYVDDLVPPMAWPFPEEALGEARENF